MPLGDHWLLRVTNRRPKNATAGREAAPSNPLGKWYSKDSGPYTTSTMVRLRRKVTIRNAKLAVLNKLNDKDDDAPLDPELFGLYHVDLHMHPRYGLPALPKPEKLASGAKSRMIARGKDEEEALTLLQDRIPFTRDGRRVEAGGGGGGGGAGVTESSIELVACISAAEPGPRAKAMQLCGSCGKLGLRSCVHCLCESNGACGNTGEDGHRAESLHSCHGLRMVNERYCSGCRRWCYGKRGEDVAAAGAAVSTGWEGEKGEAGTSVSAPAAAAAATGGSTSAASLASLESAAVPEAPSAASSPRITGTSTSKCWVCNLAKGQSKLPRDEATIRIDFKDGMPVLPTGLSLDFLRSLSPKVTPAGYEQDLRDLMDVRRISLLGPAEGKGAGARRSEAEEILRIQLEQQINSLEAAWVHQQQSWGVEGVHKHHKVVAVTEPGMATLLTGTTGDGFGTHVYEPPTNPLASDVKGWGSAGRLRPLYQDSTLPKAPIIYEPSLAPQLAPLVVLEKLYGKEEAARCLAIMISANFQHGRIQFHQDSPVEGDGHGDRIATMCLRRRAVIKLHSYATHLTYSFVVEHGDIWGMRDSIIFEPVEEEQVEEGGSIPCTWVHGVDIDELTDAAGNVTEHHSGCRACRISLNYRFVMKGSALPALTRRAVAIKRAKPKAGAGGGGAAGSEGKGPSSRRRRRRRAWGAENMKENNKTFVNEDTCCCLPTPRVSLLAHRRPGPWFGYIFKYSSSKFKSAVGFNGLHVHEIRQESKSQVSMCRFK